MHQSAQDATWLSRKTYPLEILLALGNEKCSGAEQNMLRNIIQAARWQGSLTSQLVYWSPSSGYSTCTSAKYSETPNPKARYRYASLTKLITAQAILQAMKEHELPLDTPLSYFINQANAAKDQRWAQITIQQLLTHSAGFDRQRSPDPMTRHSVSPWCPGDLHQLIDVTLDFTPGSAYGYSNLTYCLLGVVLEKLAEQPYRDVIIDHLNFKNYSISFVDGPYLADEVTYDFRHSGFYTDNYYKYLDFTALSSSAGLSGTAKDLVEWLVDQRKTQKLMVTESIWPKNCDLTLKRNCYGFALFPYRQADKELLIQAQQGYIFGSSSSLLFDDQGGILLWLGNGTSPNGSASDHMLEVMYQQLTNFYKNKAID